MRRISSTKVRFTQGEKQHDATYFGISPVHDSILPATSNFYGVKNVRAGRGGGRVRVDYD